jgi:hypothetical protein
VKEKERGRYAYAIGVERDGSASAEWLAGWDEAFANAQKGRDVQGLPQQIPHLCARDCRKVCVCNDTTKRACAVPSYPPAPPSIRALVAKALRKIADTLSP